MEEQSRPVRSRPQAGAHTGKGQSPRNMGVAFAGKACIMGAKQSPAKDSEGA